MSSPSPNPKPSFLNLPLLANFYKLTGMSSLVSTYILCSSEVVAVVGTCPPLRCSGAWAPGSNWAQRASPSPPSSRGPLLAPGQPLPRGAGVGSCHSSSLDIGYVLWWIDSSHYQPSETHNIILIISSLIMVPQFMIYNFALHICHKPFSGQVVQK